MKARTYPVPATALLSAGILAAGLVGPPSSSHRESAAAAVRTVQPAGPASHRPPSWSETVKSLLDRRDVVVPVVDAVDWAAGAGRSASPVTLVRVNRTTASPTRPNNAALALPTATEADPLGAVVAVVLGVPLLVFIGGLIAVAYVYGFIGYNIIDPILGLFGGSAASAADEASIAEVEETPTAGHETPAVQPEPRHMSPLGAVRSVATQVKKAVADVRASLDARDMVNANVSGVNSDDEGAGPLSAVDGGEKTAAEPKPTRKTPVRDAIVKLRDGLTDAVGQLRRDVKRALRGDGTPGQQSSGAAGVTP